MKEENSLLLEGSKTEWEILEYPISRAEHSRMEQSEG
jgi:hypothetical protein